MGKVKEQNTKICPILSIGQNLNQYGHNIRQVACQKTQCKWWNGDVKCGMCIIEEILDVLRDISAVKGGKDDTGEF